MRLALAALVLGACAGPSATTAGGQNADVLARYPQCAGGATVMQRDADLELLGVDPALRARIDAQARRDGLVTLRVEEGRCHFAVEVLACTRPAQWVAAPPPAADAGEFPTAWLLDPSRGTVGGAALRARAGTRWHLSLKRSFTGARRADGLADLERARFAGRWGALKPGIEPPIVASDLRGPDCPRATHWVTSIMDGAYELRAASREGVPFTDPPIDAGSGAIGIHVRAIKTRAPLPAAFPGILRQPVAACPPPYAGQMTEQAAQARRLFEAEKWADAFVALQRVAMRATGDDTGNEQLAGYLAGVALGELGRFDEAAQVLAPIAQSPCHYRRGEAAFWLTIRDRRATF